ncbi:hypothetical protein EC957_009090 [Mortierella hygrophila]|uniref:Uncharacterized protein n=1 Tax=Mortierella hygrophila TaxID=979708 RepID=A0A9P6FBG8_9FUNG|nr:hypothetical protein EC957_009090 [Mortierella hygrophila]
MDWDSSREYDSRTFSEDYNLHGASRRSDDHPSATQDEHGFLRDLGGHEGDDDDDRSIDNADMDLIEQIFEGKPPRQPTYQGQGGAQKATHQTDENSVSSMMRYMLEGSQDPVDIQESPAFDPTRPHTGSHNDRQMPLGDDANEDHFRDWSGSTPKRQMRYTSENIKIPKASPFAKRSLLPTRQSSEHIPRSAVRHTRGVSTDDGPKKTTLPMSSIPTRARAGSGAGQGTSPVTFAAKITTRPIDKSHTDQQQQHPKPIFRSAMKPPSGSLGVNSLLPRKLGRHIQLPSELSDDDDISDEQQNDRDLDGNDDDGKESQPSPTVINYTQDQDPPEAEDIADTVPFPTGTVPAPVPVPASVPGPTRFTRISKPNVSSSSSPGKKPIATIPTPQDTPQDDGNEEAQKSVKELKALLRRLGMMPFSTTLDTALESLDDAIVKKGGLCEMMGLVQKLGAMCEKQKEVIHQMTDQIIAGETCSQQLVVDSEAEEKLQKVHRQLADVQNELEKSKTANYELELEVDYLRQAAEEDRNNKEAAEPTTTRDNNNLVDASSQVSGSWATTEAAAVLLLSKSKPSKDTDSTSNPTRSSPKTAAEPSSPTLVSSAAWREHIQKIEQELAALKTALEPQRPSLTANETPLKGKAEGKEAEAKLLLKVEDLEEQLYDALLENRRLQVKIKTLARELLSTNIDLVSEDQKSQMTKHETTILKDVMLRLGVETPQQVMSALDEIQRILQDVPRQRRFIAKAEKVIWESEIQEGTVRVQRHPQSCVGEDDLKKQKRQQQQQYQQGDVTLVMDGSDLPIKPGRTCSEGYEATLQRLREWSELLDVLNHVKFVDDFDDNATVLA